MAAAGQLPDRGLVAGPAIAEPKTLAVRLEMCSAFQETGAIEPIDRGQPILNLANKRRKVAITSDNVS